jgi:hypothetical protein
MISPNKSNMKTKYFQTHTVKTSLHDNIWIE